MRNKLIYLLAFVFLVLIFQNVFAQKCKDYLIYDYADPIVDYGIDTTGSWWIQTTPFTGGYRYIINSEENPIFRKIWPIKFSSNGENWIYIASDMVNTFIITSDTTISIYAQSIYEYGFNQNGKNPYWVISNGIETEIHFNNQIARILNYYGPVIINPKGDKYAVVLQRGNQFLIATNNFETDYFEQVKPLGFLEDDSFVFAGKKGNFWQIYRNKMPISELLESIIETKINPKGTVAAFLVRNTVGDAMCFLYSDEFNDVVISRPYDNCSYLALHPFEPLVAYLAEKNNNFFMVYGNTEYNLGNFTAYPFFSNDGSELLYSYCNIECYLFVDGQRFTVPSGLLTQRRIVRKPKTTTFCISSSTGMIMYDYFSGIQYSGTLTDEMTEPVYVYRDASYQALGRIGNKIYLLTCKP